MNSIELYAVINCCVAPEIHIHDAVLVPASAESIAYETMMQVFREHNRSFAALRINVRFADLAAA